MAKTLFIDLGTRSWSIEESPKKDLELFLGARGYAAKILYDKVGPETAPFDPQNLLIFSVGPFTGTNWPTAARMTVTAKSPATGAYGYGNVGGFVGKEIRRAGYDAIVISGQSKTPCLVRIEDERAEILDAEDLWGTDAVETEKILKNRFEKHQVCCIGQGGENRVRFAGIITDGGRAAGRTGVGAVMGSKNLKALAVRGTRPAETSSDFKKLGVSKTRQLMASEAAQNYKRWGTSILLNYKNPRGDIPTNNYQSGQAPRISNMNAQALDAYVDKTHGCFACPIVCGRHSRVPSGKYAHEASGPEYETVNSFGPLVGNEDMEVALYASSLCNRYGIDTISSGSMIAFAMECRQKGLLTDPEFSLEWGDAGSILGLIEAIAFRKGLGNILADGVKEAAEKIGPETKKFALHVKGVETPRQEPRANRGMALAHVTSARGADHLYGLTTIDQTKNREAAQRYFPGAGEEIYDVFSQKYKPEMMILAEAVGAVTDALGICKFSTVEAYALGPEDLAEGASLFFGRTMTMKDLLLIGERIVNLERMYNVRHGMDRKDDVLPERFTREPLTIYEEKGGALTDREIRTGLLVDLDPMLDDYYRLRGWSKEGIPGKEKLQELSLEDI